MIFLAAGLTSCSHLACVIDPKDGCVCAVVCMAIKYAMMAILSRDYTCACFLNGQFGILSLNYPLYRLKF